MAGGVVIVGGGLGALRTAQALRDAGADQDITLLTEEQTLPYDRPPLSKGFLTGAVSERDVALEEAEGLSESAISVRLGTRAVGLDLNRRVVRLEDGGDVVYDDLILATGARPRRLAMLERAGGGALYLRDLDSARRLRSALGPDARVGIIGGGFIGLEIAAVARTLGATVTVIEMAPTPLGAVIGDELGGVVRAWHEGHGVQFRCNSGVLSADGDTQLERLTLVDGEVVDVDVVIAGVGVAPDVGWLADAGLETHHGVIADAGARTSDPHVFAVGDVTCHHDGGECTRSGHWTATNEHARAAAASVLGLSAGDAVTQPGYFWSDQYDKRLQFAGRLPAEPVPELVSGSYEENTFVTMIMDGDRLAAVFAMGSVRDFIKASAPLRGRPSDTRAPAREPVV